MLLFRTYADLDRYMARRWQDFPWKILAVVVFGLGLLAVAALAGKA